MKSLLFILIIAGTLFSCAKKMTPTAQATAINEVKPPADTPKEAVTKMESAEVVAGKNIFTTKCSRCHGTKKVDNWTVQEWVPILDRMALKARLDDAEKASVMAYVNFYAKS